MPDKKTFLLQIKGVDSTYSIKAHPRTYNGSYDNDLKTYQKRAAKYIKELDKRRLKFHKQMYRDARDYKRAIIKSKIRAWSDFRRIYLTKKEQDMSREAWLNYYFNVLSDEEEALRNSEVNFKFIDRWLALNQFRNQSEYNQLIKDSSTRMGLFTFRDDNGDNMIVTKLLVIDNTENEYAYYDGSNGLKEFVLYLKTQNNYSVIGFFLNGDVGAIRAVDFNDIVFAGNRVNSLKMQRTGKDIASIGMILSKCGL
jgi:hypothetical protein